MDAVTQKKMTMVADILRRKLTEGEAIIAEEMLSAKPTTFGGSNAPMYVAMRLDMLSRAEGKSGKKVNVIKEDKTEQSNCTNP